MNENERMELMETIAATQPDTLTSTQKMQLGIWRSSHKPATTGLSPEAKLRLRGLKQSISQDVLSAEERISLALEIQNLENIGEKK